MRSLQVFIGCLLCGLVREVKSPEVESPELPTKTSTNLTYFVLYYYTREGHIYITCANYKIRTCDIVLNVQYKLLNINETQI
jgi:hypothetical protein